MSPLLLEAIFACATLMIGDTAQGNKWLAVASSEFLPDNLNDGVDETN